MELLSPYTAKYDVRYNGFKVGELVQQLKPVVDGRQVMQTRAYTTGATAFFMKDSITEQSTWKFTKDKPALISYSQIHEKRRETKREFLDFDWQKGELKSERKGKVTTLPLEPGTLDKHMYQVVLRQDVAAGTKEMSYTVAERGKLRQYDFQVMGEEQLKTRHFGKLSCIKVEKGDTTIWLASKYAYLPVKLTSRKNGSTATTTLIELQY
jgi:hypothetical protein